MIVRASRVVTPDSILEPGWLRLTGTQIADLGAGEPPVTSAADLDLGAATVVPGFVDAHAHGGGGRSFDEGTAEAADVVLRTHAAHGTTSMVASLVTMPTPDLQRALSSLGELVAEDRLAGVHLEGPWLSPSHAGAHRPDLLSHPTAEAIDSTLAAGDGTIRMVTVAPELPGGVEAIRRLVDAGVVAAIGHTDAGYDGTLFALDAGARVGTHLFNAMRGMRHRDPGPVPALLEHPDTYVELIADGVHVHPAVLRLATDVKSERSTLVTDAMAASGARDGEYHLGPLAVTVREGVARLADHQGQPGAIAGSTLTLDRAVRFAVEQIGLPLVDAVRAAATTPATMLGLAGIGALRPGYSADLVVLDESLQVRRVMRRGAWLS